MTRQSFSNRIDRTAFTLIELLVVMAITAILLGLIFGPLIQSFNLTNRARVQALTQDSARRAMEIGFRDLSNGVFVFDNAQQPVTLWVVDKAGTNVVPMPVPYAMVDLVPPARAQDQSNTLQPQDIDPTTGLALKRGSLALPVAPGRVIVRYFLGLRNNTSADSAPVAPSRLRGKPAKPYFNFYNNPRAGSLTNHNPVILYRAVISPYLPDGRIDLRFFAAEDENGNLVANPAAGQNVHPVVYDANFFYDTSAPPAGLPPIPGFASANAANNAQGYGQRWENWKSVARAMVPTDRADEVVHVLDDTGQPSYFTVNGIDYPRLNPLVRFQPTYVGNDAGSPTSTSDRPEGAIDVPPSTYVEQYGHWTLPYRLYMYTQSLDANPLSLFFWQNNGNVTDPVLAQTWDIPASTLQNSADAFLQPNQTPRNYGLGTQQPLLLDPTTGIQINPATEGTLFSSPPLVLFTADARRGVINCAFPDSVMLHGPKGPAVLPDGSKVYYPPTPSAWPNDSTTPNVAYPGDTDMPNVAAINARYELLRQAHGNDTTNLIRYVKLAKPPSNAGNSPLSVFPNAAIVPGSIVVKGPDQRPGANHGREVVYRQVSSDTAVQAIGPNEYRLGRAEHRVVYNDPDPAYNNMLNAVQHPFTIIFDSQPDNPGGPPGETHSLPTLMADGVTLAAPITVTYQFQTNLVINNGLADPARAFSVKADYLTRQLMTFSLGVRLYEFNSGQPQQVTLTQKIKIRNLQR